jgi:hypothetical protein
MNRKSEAARLLAAIHFDVEDGLTHVYRLHASMQAESREEEPIKLLEVHEGTVATGVLPLRFSPTPDVPYSSVIIEVTPEEFERIQRRELPLPNGWTLGDEFVRPVLELAG